MIMNARGTHHRIAAPALLRLIAAVALTVGLGMGSARAADEQGQRTFTTPEEAAEALIAGLPNDEAMLAIFGRKHEAELFGADRVTSRERRKETAAEAQSMHSLRKDGEARRILIIGAEAWPVPFPIVKDGKRWRFDTEAGLEEIIDRRIGKNELHAIEIAEAYLAAQQEYGRRDRDGDDVLEYAQRFGSSPGKKDGLYWEVAPGSGEEESPFGPLLAEAHGYLKNYAPGEPFEGYFFRILSRQGEHAPGGRDDYVRNGNMIAGFALVAYPGEYDDTGIMTFIVNQQGKVYQRDLGEFTEGYGEALEVYDPDDTWVEVQN